MHPELLSQLIETCRHNVASDEPMRVNHESLESAVVQLADRSDNYAAEINHLRNVIQAACLGGTDLMIERWKQLFPDAPVPSVKPPVATSEMVNRFLGWPLPKDFLPDCGISFDGRKDDEWNKNKTWPIGTNLFTAEQAKAMLQHALGG
jgi:hypothetical protein